MERAERLARMHKALGDPTRLRIFHFLRERCCRIAVGEDGDVHPLDGPSVGEVCCHITGRDKINSTISFHIGELKDAGLITVEKRGRFMVCGMNREAIDALVQHLLESAGPAGGGDCS